MWKWILAIVAIIVLGLFGLCYAGYRSVTAHGNTATVTLAAPPERVFAMLTTPDSIAAWMGPGTEILPALKRLLHVGDTDRLTPSLAANGGRRETQVWVIREIASPSRYVADDVRFDQSGQ